MLIYTDHFEAYNAATFLRTADYLGTMFSGFIYRDVYPLNSNGGTTFDIATGINTDKALALTVDGRNKFASTGASDQAGGITLLRPTTNVTATHWASFDFKWHNNDAGSRVKPSSFFAFNDANMADQWSSQAVAPLVMLTQDGAVHVGGNASAVGVIPIDVSRHVDIEVLPTTAQVNVYVDGVLVVSSPTDLPWLLTGLTALGPRCDCWPISADAREQGPILAETFDNLTIYDSTGTTFNSRLTSGVLYKRLPLVTQVDANFANTGGAASTIAALSDYTGAVFNTVTYAKSPVDNDLADTFKLDTSSIGALDTILGVSVVNVARRNALGNRHIETRMKNGAAVVDINHTPKTPIDFTVSNPVFAEKNPNGSAWTPANLAATEFGYVAKAS